MNEIKTKQAITHGQTNGNKGLSYCSMHVRLFFVVLVLKQKRLEQIKFKIFKTSKMTFFLISNRFWLICLDFVFFIICICVWRRLLSEWDLSLPFSVPFSECPSIDTIVVLIGTAIPVQCFIFFPQCFATIWDAYTKNFILKYMSVLLLQSMCCVLLGVCLAVKSDHSPFPCSCHFSCIIWGRTVRAVQTQGKFSPYSVLGCFVE